MSTTITVESGGDRRVFTAADLPLSVGGSGCHVPFGGPRIDGPIAFFGHDGGELFIQPAEGPDIKQPMTCNGVRLTASRWLGDGDELAIGDHRMKCEISGTSVRLMVIDPDREPSRAAAANTSKAVPSPAHDHIIVPVDFEPRWQSSPQRSRITIRPRSLLLIIATVLLATCAWFVLTARAVHIETIPVEGAEDRRQLPSAARHLHSFGPAGGISQHSENRRDQRHRTLHDRTDLRTARGPAERCLETG